MLGVNHKVRTLRFCNFRHLPAVRAHTLFPPPSRSVRIVLFKEDMTDIFCELLSIKEPQKTLQNKETTAQSYRKMSN